MVTGAFGLVPISEIRLENVWDTGKEKSLWRRKEVSVNPAVGDHGCNKYE